MDDEERRRIERLQKLADGQWKTPRAIPLDGPGPFALPLCGHVSASGEGSGPKIVLQLETVGQSQPVWVPIVTSELPGLKALVDYLCSQYVAANRRPQ